MSILTITRVIALSLEYIAFIAACFAYKYHNTTFRIIFYLLVFIVINESLDLYIGFTDIKLYEKTTFGAVLLVFMESISVCLLGLKISSNRAYRVCIRLGLGIVLVYSLLNIYFNGPWAYPTAPILFLCVEGLIVFLGIIIQQSDTKHFFRQPIFFLSLGMIIFYGCIMPYVSVVNYFYKVAPRTLAKLFQILAISNYIRYSLSAVAYIVLYRQQKAKQLKMTENLNA